ncbi:hypothetical protein CVT26_001545 [Gymnopilus dilepis]|uniref:Thaumatin-like protein n=1 Tax=Gymnopilus dilepis TaxID=231916 RepID=A0A409WAT2_9AGAR|nr:hypothetical protein CVT26_001545 [Gymnopilus dilepis]
MTRRKQHLILFNLRPAIFTDLNVAANVPDFPTGWVDTWDTSSAFAVLISKNLLCNRWEASPMSRVSFSVPDDWKSGRIWARRGCNFSNSSGSNSCLDGGCNGGLLCDPHTGTGVPPATVAEWTLQGDGYRDFYDVSLVDGYNLPARIDNNQGCPVADCPVDLGSNCPTPLKGPFDSTGASVGCKSACDANLDGDPVIGVALLTSKVSARTFTVVNACPFTIWPAMFTDLNVAPNVPNFPTGWEAGPMSKVSFTVPDNWKAGRIWARRDCDFSTNPGPNSCLDGGCNGGLLCDPHTGTGVPPATVAEWTLQGDGNKDFYDVSLVDGYNLPAKIDNNKGCPVADCAVDLGPNCPAPLKGPFDATGFPVGCKSACDANLDGNPSYKAGRYRSIRPSPVPGPPQSIMKTYILASSFAFLSGVYNACPFTIWPAMFTDMNVPGNSAPSFTTGWSAGPYTSVTFNIPNNWQAGRIWARRDCDFSSNPGPNSCLDGGCNGGLVCDPHTGTGVPPASLAEFTLSGSGNKDYYDVSLVDGYNLPIRIDNNVGCPVPKCAVDLGPNCPAPLKGPFDSTGFPVGCKSACIANLSGNPANSPNCCSGSYDTPATCPSSGVAYYSYFKNNCPDAYAYPYDESSGTAIWNCPSNLQASYTVTFCPAS